MSGIVSGVSLNETVYDADSHILWTRFATDVAGIGHVLGLMGARLTENGMIQIMGYAKESDFPEWSPLFEAIIKQTEIAEHARYKPRFTDAIPAIFRVDWRIV